MSMMDRLTTGGANKPPIGIIYGRPGIGKTTVAAQAPGAIFVQTEDGLTSPILANAQTFGVLQSYQEVKQAFSTIVEHKEAQGWQTIVVDSIDRMSPLIARYVCEQNGWKTLEDGAYGRGKVAFVDEWRNLMTSLLYLRNECHLGVLMLGHHKTKRVTPPDTDAYSQFDLALPDDVSRTLIGDSDFVLFATIPMNMVSSDAGFGKKINRAIADKPVFMTQETGAHVAKNRFGMPAKILMDWPTLASYVPAWSAKLPVAPETVVEDVA